MVQQSAMFLIEQLCHHWHGDPNKTKLEKEVILLQSQLRQYLLKEASFLKTLLAGIYYTG